MAAFLGVVAVQTAIHGEQAFEHDAGANFSLFFLGVLFAFPTFILCFIFVFRRLRRRIFPSELPN